MFLTDLIRKITIPHCIDFMAVSSCGVGARKSSGQSRITLDINTDINGRDVLVIEDIVDSGFTIKAVILDFLSTRQPKSLRVCTLLNKADRREVEVPIHYCGFIIPDKFVFVYGLDIDEYYRNLPFIGVLAADRYSPRDDSEEMLMAGVGADSVDKKTKKSNKFVIGMQRPSRATPSWQADTSPRPAR